MKKILIATDYSENAINALKYGAELALKTDGQLMLAHAYQPPVFYTADMPPSVIEDSEKSSLQAAEDNMKRMMDLVENIYPNLACKYQVKRGLPGETVSQLAKHWGADLVITGATNASLIERFVVGSSATEIINKAPCMVLVIPPSARFRPIKRAVFATDLVEDHLKEYKQVSDLLRTFNAELKFLFIDHSVHADSEEIDNRMSKMIKTIVDFENKSGFICSSNNVEKGIHEFLSDSNADWVIAVTEHRRFPEMLFHRSISKKIAYHPDKPLLVLHSQKTALPV